jgi:hypothetical protein
MSITIRDLLEAVSAIPQLLFDWFGDLFCKVGLGVECSIYNWSELTLGQAALIGFLIWAISVSVWKDLLAKNGKSVAIAKLISVPAGVFVFGALVVTEIYILSGMGKGIGEYVPYFVIEIGIYIILILAPVLVGIFVCDRLHVMVKASVEREHL